MAPTGKVLGIIFPNMHDEAIPELTRIRTMASVPFGGRYRMIDFILSGFVAAGIDNICVVPRTSYVSLMDHIGSGKEWDLARKRGGVKIFPPYGEAGTKTGKGKIGALESIVGYIESAQCDYVVLSDCDIACAIDFDDVIKYHSENDADITIVYRREKHDPAAKSDNMTLELDGTRVSEVLINDVSDKEVNSGMWTYVINKSLLVKIIHSCKSRGLKAFEQDVLQSSTDMLNIQAYEYKGYASRITSLKSYFDANMNLLKKGNISSLFRQYPIYTKIRDDAPVRYTIGSVAKNVIEGDGCFIEGDVCSSVLFRGVKIGKDAVVRNCILMQDTVIEDGVWIENVICDKAVEISKGEKVIGSSSHPVYIGKKTRV